jgi:hypothetical protein
VVRALLLFGGFAKIKRPAGQLRRPEPALGCFNLQLRRGILMSFQSAHSFRSCSILVAVALPLAACGDKEADAGVSATDYAALAERVAVLESQLGGDGGGGDGGTTNLESLQAAVDANTAAIATTQADVAAVQDEVSTVSSSVSELNGTVTALSEVVDSLDVDALATRVDGIEADSSSYDTRLTDLETDVDAVSVRGGVWYDEGTTSGTCARVDVVTDSDKPLVVIATVDYSVSASNYSCATYGSSAYCSGSGASASGGGTLTSSLVSENVGGTSFADSATFSGNMNTTLSHYVASAVYYSYIQLGQSSGLTSAINRVLEIPAAGAYTVEVQITASSATVSSCKLVVIQP